MPVVRMTAALRQDLLEMGERPEEYIQDFSRWKSTGEAGENSFYFFGKDGAYDRPRSSDNKYVLRHVHLAPPLTSRFHYEWNVIWDRAQRSGKEPSRRVSDTVLVYADGGHYGYLLITILWEPYAHDVAEMKTEEDIELMNDMAFVAEKFVYFGKIVY